MAKKIKLAQVICGTDVAGAKGYTIDLAKLANPDKFEVWHIHPLEGMTTREAREAGIEPFVTRQNPFQIAKLIRRLDLDLIHTHGVRANFTGRIAARMAGIPSICTMHSDSRLDYDSRLKERMVWLADNLLNRWADAFIGVSDDMSEKLATRGIPRNKIHTVRNGINLSAVKPSLSPATIKRNLGISDDIRLIGTVGRLVEVKGHDDLISALPRILREVPNAGVVIVGDGRCMEPLRRQAEELRISDRVFLLGRITPPFDIMSACEVGVFPSLAEAIGLAMLEFMALKIPIVATDVCGIPEVINSEDVGILTPPKDPSNLADSIIRVLKDKQLSRRLSENGRKRVEEEFTTEHMVRQTEKIWEQYARRRNNN
jgi:glycosyltransferase involved in cell wall biosynthesis